MRLWGPSRSSATPAGTGFPPPPSRLGLGLPLCESSQPEAKELQSPGATLMLQVPPTLPAPPSPSGSPASTPTPYTISFSSRMSMLSESSWQAKPMFTAVSANQPGSAPQRPLLGGHAHPAV